MNKVLQYCFLFLITLIFCACTKTEIVNEAEKNWLKQHDNLIVGLSPNAPPYEYENENSEITGIFIDFLSLIESKINYQNTDEILSNILHVSCSKLLHITTGTEAVEACRQYPDIDVVLMDIKIPEMNGLEATRIIRAFNRKVIIIAQTANAMLGDREKALEAGCNEYLTKPFKKEVLMGLIEKYCKVYPNKN